MRHWWLVLAATAIAAPIASAQETDTTLLAPPVTRATLTLADAIGQARENSPTFRQTVNQLVPARVGVREAYGQNLPNFGVNGGVNYTGSGEQFFGGAFFRQPSSYGSSYSLGFDWQLGGATFFAPSSAKASKRAAEANVEAGSLQLSEVVVTQYLNVLQAAANSEVARQQLRRNLEFLQLTTARQRVGQTSLFDVRQADVTANNSRVELLRALQTETDQKIELYRLMGVVPPAPFREIQLSDSFPVTQAAWNLEALVGEAMDANPQLRAFRAQAEASKAQLRQARSAYFPTLSVTGGWSGFTQQFSNIDGQIAETQTGAIAGSQACRDQNIIRANVGLSTVPDCNAAFGLDASGTQLQPGVQQALVDQNDVFPFDFTTNPFTVNLRISLPIFQGFSRDLRVAEAHAVELNAKEQSRAQELQIRATVASRVQAVETAYEVIDVQRRSQIAAREQLKLAEERYRLGSGTVLEVSDALNAVTFSDAAYINAVYDHHRAIVSLYAALGRNYR
ncbi:MAG TPA: TolC family protein [Gemmatimonadales bacterium]|nr:TolC family protein [Gemmatimonadales bacterium]